MFYKKISTLALAGLSFFMFQASAGGSGESFDDRFYVSGNYGVSVNRTKPNYGEDFENEKTPKSSNIFGFGVGYKLNENFRSELKYMNFGSSEYKADISDGSGDFLNHDVNSKALFANLYYDFNEIAEGLTPYISIGAGFAKNKATDARIFEDDLSETSSVYKGSSKNSVAWNIGTGLSYKMSNKVSWDVIQYNYFDLGKYNTKALDADSGALKGRVKVHTFTTGIRISL